MKKVELLDLLVQEYERTVRLPDDISLNDYRSAIERKTGARVSYARAIKTLNALPGFVSLLVVDRGKVTRVWRKTGKGEK